MPKIAVTIICKDDSEEKNLKRCLNSIAKYTDGLFITTTGKKVKKIQKVCKEYGAHYSHFPWVKDFSKARNFNFNQVPKEYDWIFWLDTDDLLVGGGSLHDVAKLADENNVKAVFARYLYQVELDEQGKIKNILIEHLRERLIKNDGTFEWVAPIHETLIERVPSGKTDTQSFYVVQITDYSKMEASMYRNIDILETEVMNNPQDPRPIYYLAKAYFDTKTPELLYESVGEGLDSVTMELCKDYIRKSGWPEERAQCWEYMSMIHREKNEFKKGIYCLLEALYEAPTFSSIYIQLALCYVIMKDWVKALHWVKIAGMVEIPKTTLVINPRDYKAMILEALFHIYLNTGKLEECLKVMQGLSELVPNEMNQNRLKELMELIERNNMAKYVLSVANYLNTTKQVPQLKALINSIPVQIANEPVMQDLRRTFSPPRTWGEDEIMIYCGPGFEKWSPKNVARGIGGSEEAVIYLTRELAKKGWKVTVYGDPQDEEGEYEGVKYVSYSSVNWQDNFNILISWRQPGLFDLPLHTKRSYLWLHDIQNPLEYTPERLAKIDKVMFLSKWHRGNVPALPEEKVMITSNGINI